jgi:hypothetical protein
MDNMSDRLFSIETQAGEPIKAGDVKLVPFSQAVSLRFPGLNGGFIWNRPVSVLTVLPDGQEQVIAVRDVTREAQIIVLGMGIVGSILMLTINRIFRKGAK